jgi:hypothetical protein
MFISGNDTMQASQTLTAGQVMSVARPGSRKTFMELRDGLKVGRTSDGAPRPFSVVEAAMFTLAARLTGHGLRRVEAIAIASQARDDLARLIENPADDRRWLIASRQNDADPWSIQVVDEFGSPEIFDDEASETFAAINLRRVVRDVLATGAHVA